MKDRYFGALLEDIDNKMDSILESLSLMATSLELKAVDDRLTRVEEDVKIIKQVVTQHSHDIRILQQTRAAGS